VTKGKLKVGLSEVLILLSVGAGVFLWLRRSANHPKQPADDQPQPILLLDDTLLDYIDQGRKLDAIRYYREQTGTPLKRSRLAVERIMAHRDDLDALTKKGRDPEDLPVGDGIRDLIAAGEVERAVEVYRQFAGVDEYTARQAIEALQSDHGGNSQHV